MACCVANYWGAITPSTTARRLAGIAPTLAPPAHSAARVSTPLAPSAQTSNTPTTHTPPSTSPSPPSIDTPDVFRDVTREPELLIAAVGSIARREGGWTVQADLKLIMSYWRYLLDPVRHSVNRLVIDDRRRSTRRSRTRSSLSRKRDTRLLVGGVAAGSRWVRSGRLPVETGGRRLLYFQTIRVGVYFQPERHSSVVLRFLHPTSHVFCVVNVARQARAGVSWTT